MKKNLLKSILMAVALIFGTTGAWADEITATLVHTASSYSQGTAGSFTSTVDAEKETVNNSNFTGTWAGAAYADFSFSIPEGQTIQSATLTFTGVGERRNTRNTDVMYANADATLDYEALSAGSAEANLDATKITSVTFPKGDGATKEFTVDATDAVKAMVTAGKSGVIFKLTGNPGGGSLMGKGSDVAPTLVITTVSASAQTSYTVKFTDAAGNELKEAVKYDVLIGNEATASAADMASFFNTDKTMKYIYVSGNQNITAAENAESNVITLVFREAEKFAYTLNSSLGTTIKEGTDWEGETLNVAYPRYLAQDGTLYSAGKGSAGYYLKTIELNQNNVEATIDYTAGENGVVFIAEAEDIETLTVSTAANSNIRCSNGLCAYNAGESDAVIATLPNGKYKLYTSVWGNATTEFVFKAGENQILSISSAGYILDGNSEEFELNAASTAITLGTTDNAGRGIDFVYIIKTGDAELAAPVAANGKMDFIAMNHATSTTSSHDGDIPETGETFNADEFSVTVSASTTSTANRFWAANGGSQLRVYGGTITVKAAAGKILNKIVFDQSQWGGMTVNVGTLDAQTWTGEAEEVVFTVTSQCRINAITVSDNKAPAEPVVDVANIAAFKALEAGTRAKLAVNGAKVTFAKGDNIYIEDETGALLLYKTGLTMTAGKAITGFINGAYTDYKGLAELTAIDVTPASEFTEADADITATVMTVAEANVVANASKLVKLENVNINADLQNITQGEDEIAFYDKFGVMADYTYPAVAKSIVGIINTASGYNTFHPVSPDSIVAGDVVIPEVANIAAAKEADVRGTEIKLNVTGAKVTLYGGNNMTESFIEDETGAIMVDFNITKLLGEDGVTLTGYIIGKVTKDQRQGGVFKFEGTENTASSEITKEATEIVPTTTTIADINAGQVADVTSKYIRLENVNVKYESTGWSADIYLVDGDQELYVNDAMFILPQDMSIVEKFNSISGIVIYGYYGLEFIPYGTFDAVEKQIVFTEVANIAALKDIANDTDIKLALNNTQIKVLEGGRWSKTVYIEDETAGIQINDNEGTIFTEFGQTFNGYIYLKYKDEYGMKNLETAGYTKNSEYTVEVKEVVAKEVAWADATSANYNQKLIKVNNVELAKKTITEGEGEDATSYDLLYLKSGDKDMNMSDMFSKAYDENGGSLEPGMYNITGIIMEGPVYDENYEVAGYTDYFIPAGETAFEAVTVAEGRKWQFDAMGEADEALLAADTENWATASNNRYQNNVALNNEVLKANGAELEVTKGLLFTADTKKLLLGSGISGSNHYMQVQKGSSFVVTNLAVGDTVRMVVKTASKTATTVVAPASSVANIIEGFEATAEQHTCTLVMCEAGDLTLKGDNADIRFFSLEVIAGNPNEVANLRKWDFTAWSDETKANLAADAATVKPTENEDGTLTYPSETPWRTYEKVGGPTETEPDHGGDAYWYGTAIDGSEELVANSVVIAETKGLFFNKMSAGALAIGVNYPVALSTYEGPSYLWIGGKSHSFTIPNVKSGSKITMGVESHKTSDARGVTLAIDGTEIGRAVPKTYEVFDITVPGELTDGTLSDVVVTNTNGCHIYFITVNATGVEDGINEVKAEVKVVNNNVYTINGVKVRNAGDSLEGLAKGIYIIGGKKVVVK